ncbi:hypothetical protein OCU04_007495 [Sclerotinia nivalis]|uniref:non-specific serine/threonine protein kinase n=1 Tax=Sclerotinia nivalis TaxID=352851 RepID=A0A9X0AIW4_9HELO|nr:hypothetical protein OCU04_007495 [Sclerotinia nivalis]
MTWKESSFNEFFKRWQTREAQWKDRLGDGWVITRTLGAGAGGGASLWEWRGDPEVNAPEIKKVVVKIVYDGYENYPDTYTGLREEAAFLDLLRTIPTKHLIHMYGPPKRDDRDHVMYFLEMCPGGALSSVLKQHEDEEETKRSPVSESDLWSIFHCLARAVTAMDRGTEDLEKERWDRDEIGHYDMITSNILIGCNDEIHKRCPIVKVGDFGDAMEIRRLELQTDDTGREDVYSRGAMGCRPPEQCNENVRHLRHGTCSNIYMVGLIMIRLISSRSHAPMYTDEVGVIDYNENLRKGETMGGCLHYYKDYRDAYSQTLRALIMECCMKEPLLRPRAAELQDRTGEMFELVANVIGEDIDASSGFGNDNVLLGNFEPPKEWMGLDDVSGADDVGDGEAAMSPDGIDEPNPISSDEEDEGGYDEDVDSDIDDDGGDRTAVPEWSKKRRRDEADLISELEQPRKRRRDEANLLPELERPRKRRHNKANPEPSRKRRRGNNNNDCKVL